MDYWKSHWERRKEIQLYGEKYLKGGKGRGREIDRKEEGKTKREGDRERG
jgi:hypothetical protein